MVSIVGFKLTSKHPFWDHGKFKRKHRTQLIIVVVFILLLTIWKIFKEKTSEHSGYLARRGGVQNVLVGDDFYTSDALSARQPRESSNVAVIIETDITKVPNLVPIVLHFAMVLGPTWPVVLMTLEANWNPPDSPAFKRLMDDNQIRVIFLPSETSLSEHHSVSVFLTSPWIWEQLYSFNRVLLFQADSMICSKSPMQIEDFFEWDLIGAPIAPQFGHGYNGGLSLRNPKLMFNITSDPDVALGANEFEDQWFDAKVRERSGKLPTPEQAMKFAVETMYHDKPLGYHQPHRWQQGNLDEIAEWCPEISLLQGGGHFFR
ncbi:hypothetical protein GQ607_011409 [Colletotrichum asianum]|uniref:DUF5672 domain-containing protein n=1 Tax=Colletotrichum asianum TaxID=702518 RepID=A0A8H3W2Y2_9PEZI|nr:hypothetical protein GQ607_011409 [Colletotrichum asianum]